MDLLSLCQYDGLITRGHGPRSGIKLLRHNHRNRDILALLRTNSDYLAAHQAHQATDIFKNCNAILAFVSDGQSRAIFRGAWELQGSISHTEYSRKYTFARQVIQAEQNGTANPSEFYYNTSPLPALADLIDRLVIEWGGSTLAWHQWIAPKEVIEVLPRNYIGEFPGFYEIVLTYNQLRRLIANPDSNRVWLHQLSQVAGVYLILDSKSGMQYVGSAYGRDGVWGRWSSYATNPSGGNRLLAELLDKNGSEYAEYFQFSILRALDRTTPNNQVIMTEGIEKKKLGTRAFGLTMN